MNIVSIPGCPPIVSVRQSPGILDRSNCDRLGYTDVVLQEIIALSPTVIILTARWDLYFHGFTRNGAIEKTSHFLTTSSTDSADKTSTMTALEKQIPETLERIASAGITVLVITNPPVLSGNLANLRENVSISEAGHQEYQEPVRSILQKIDVAYFGAAALQR